jgi:hypothetical protein
MVKNQNANTGRGNKKAEKNVPQTFDARKGAFVDIPMESKAVESWSEFYSEEHRTFMFKYEFTTADGEVFTCEARTIKKAHELRDEWLAEADNKAEDKKE